VWPKLPELVKPEAFIRPEFNSEIIRITCGVVVKQTVTKLNQLFCGTTYKSRHETGCVLHN
jgi:hypothetical protein